MCRYWKKLHTCTHPSDRPYIEMCRSGFLSNTVCHDISEDSILRPSHFPCWSCVKALGRADAEEKRRLADMQANAAATAREAAIKARREAEKKMREERVRREAREKAEHEKAEEVKIKMDREKEAERGKGGRRVGAGRGGQWEEEEEG
ncbi:hypothetical protein N0V86_004692 [Didymella sp. IMI 355093]|nr:hypothetical protein N0V86_004692 [Didymella sp. IMI 355093]